MYFPGKTEHKVLFFLHKTNTSLQAMLSDESSNLLFFRYKISLRNQKKYESFQIWIFDLSDVCRITRSMRLANQYHLGNSCQRISNGANGQPFRTRSTLKKLRSTLVLAPLLRRKLSSKLTTSE